jgi:sec-independent protein translocase protein TatB
MFDIGWSELLIIGVVAVVVIGPKDLPKVMRAIGIYAGKARALARDFQGQWDDVMRQAELEEMKKQVEKIASEPQKEIEKAIEPFANLDPKIDITGLGPTPTPASEAPKEVATAAPAPEAPKEIAPAAPEAAPAKPAGPA